MEMNNKLMMEKKLENIDLMIDMELKKVMKMAYTAENDMEAEKIYNYINELEQWKKEVIAYHESLEKFENSKVARN
jgi:hypothetical protein